MEIRLHANATTTPKQRAYLQASTRPTAELAVEIGVSETTDRWRESRLDALYWRNSSRNRLDGYNLALPQLSNKDSASFQNSISLFFSPNSL